MAKSFHPPYSKFVVNVSQPGHVGVAGVSDFETNDELYMGIVFNEGNDVFITGDAEDGTYPWRGEDTVHAGRHLPPGLDAPVRRRQGVRNPAGPQWPQLRDGQSSSASF